MAVNSKEGTGIMVKNEKVEDIDAVEEAQVDTGEATEEIIEEVIEEIEEIDEVEQLKAEVQEAEHKYLRILADYDNYKRRAKLDQEALQKYKAQGVLTNLIPVMDNFSRALAVEAKTDEARTMMEGMDMIYRSLSEALKTEGLTEIEALDQEFDPNFHQAIMTDHVEDKPSGVVLEELQKGYILKDRVLRPSMVKVNE